MHDLVFGNSTAISFDFREQLKYVSSFLVYTPYITLQYLLNCPQ